MPSSAGYPGEDPSPTTKRELLGWYAYGTAAEIFAVCGVGSFLPVTLEQLARERGVLRSDGITPCVAPPGSSGDATSQALFLARSLLKRDDNPCIIHLFGGEVNTASFALYTFSAAVGVQALTLISLSAIADHGGNRKLFLLAFGFVGATASMMFIFIFPQIFFVAPLLVIVAVASLGSSFTLLNSFLPLLVANDPDIRQSQPSNAIGPELPDPDDYDDGFEDWEETDVHQANGNAAKTNASTKTGGVTPEMQLSGQISSKGMGFGYLAAVSVQILSIGILLTFSKLSPATSKTTIPMRTILFIIGACWMSGTIPTMLWLRRRPGPPLPNITSSRNQAVRAFAYVVFAWRSLWRTVKTAVQLKQAVLFLLAWFLLSDAVATVSGTAILFAKTELKMATASVAAISVTACLASLAGAFSWPIIARRFGLRSNQVIIRCILLFEIVPLYGLLGYLPFIKAWGVGGLQQPWEIFPLAVVHGIVMGGLSSYCRSFYGLLIPPGHEAAFFALYAVTDKGSSVIGPAIAGRILDNTGQIRAVFWFLALLIILPLPLVWKCDSDKGTADAREMAENMRKGEGFEMQGDLRTANGREEGEGLLAERRD